MVLQTLLLLMLMLHVIAVLLFFGVVLCCCFLRSPSVVLVVVIALNGLRHVVGLHPSTLTPNTFGDLLSLWVVARVHTKRPEHPRSPVRGRVAGCGLRHSLKGVGLHDFTPCLAVTRTRSWPAQTRQALHLRTLDSVVLRC